MKIDRKNVTHVYAVLRYDKYLEGVSSLQNRITVKEIHPTLEIADAEVERLNRLEKERKGDSVYWYQTTRWRSEPLPGMEVNDEVADGDSGRSSR